MSRGDFISKYAIARKEARETHYWLRLLTASGLTEESEIPAMLQECNELIAILTAIIKKAQLERKQTMTMMGANQDHAVFSHFALRPSYFFWPLVRSGNEGSEYLSACIQSQCLVECHRNSETPDHPSSQSLSGVSGQ